MSSSKATLMIVIVLAAVTTSAMSAALLGSYDYGYGNGNGFGNDFYGAPRRHYYHRRHYPDNAFYFHRNGHAHIHPPIAVLAG